MKGYFKKKVFLIILLFIICCHYRGWALQRLEVVTSIFPLQEFARVVGGERVNAEILLPPGTEPHTWRPRPADIVNLSKADIFIYIGSGMEPWVEDLLKGVKSDLLLIIAASEGLDLISAEESESDLPGKKADQNKDSHMKDISRHHHERMDPHIWLDFENDQKIIDKIVKVFSTLDPEGTAIYTENGKRYKKKLAELDRNYSNGLRNCERSEILMGGHATFSYIAKRYGLKQISLYGLSPDAEPKPREMAEIIDFAKSKGIKAVFVEKLINDRLARIIAKEIGADTLVLNPGPNLTVKESERGITFISIMEDNLKNLTKGLGCE
ncbi:MAG: metal ABC transporter solute-binding protein, Zn/Mn family [bacterium]